NLVVVGLVRLAEVGGIGKDAGALLLHPQERRAGVETARESDADFFPFGQALQDRTHGASNRSKFLMPLVALGARISNFAPMGTRLIAAGVRKSLTPTARGLLCGGAGAGAGGSRATRGASARHRSAHPTAG